MFLHEVDISVMLFAALQSRDLCPRSELFKSSVADKCLETGNGNSMKISEI
jgi:hypothetical protein